MNECIYYKGVIPLIEDGHVNNECDGVAKHITSEIKHMLKDLSPLNFHSFIDKLDWKFSGFNVNPDYIKQMKDNIDDLSIRMFTESDTPEVYPLYYTLFNAPAERECRACNDRIIIKDAVDVSINNHNDVQVEINIAKFRKLNDALNYLSMMATISYELQHIFDKYVLTNRDFSSDNKNNPYYDFTDGNVFNLSSSESVSDDYKIVDTILYTVTHTEQRGILSELRTTLVGISMNDELKERLFVSTIHNKFNLQGYPMLQDRNDFTEDMLIEHVYSHPLIKNIFRTYVMDVVYEKLDKLSKTDKKHYDYLILIVGYYMCKHNMLRLPKYHVCESEAQHMFSKENIDNIVDYKNHCVTKDVPDKFIHTVEYSMDYEFNRYIREVKDEIKRHLYDIFNYKKFGIYMNEANCDAYLMTLSEYDSLQLEKQIILYD